MTSVDFDYWLGLLRSLVAGRKIVLAPGMLVGAVRDIALLRELGAERPLILAEAVGAGEPPSAQDADWCIVGTREGSVMDSIRGYNEALGRLPAAALAALERYDPRRTALVLRAFTVGVGEVGGRPVYGRRRPEWIALEDKLVLDELWEAAGVERAPARIVPARPDELRRAARALDQGAGTVWAGDNKEGWHGGATYTRPVRGDEGREEAERYFARHCDRVRVMPFLEGLPCSIHGIVLQDAVIALRPVELVVLRRTGRSEFLYAGCATFWDPAPADREYIRGVARRVGAELRDRVRFRGAFTIDGVMTAAGFLPTELNPRYGAGLRALVGREGPPLHLLDLAIAAEEPWDFRPAALEALIVGIGDRIRGGGGGTVSPFPSQETRTYELVEIEGRYMLASEGEARDATLMIGPNPAGSFLRFTLDPARHPPGEPAAPKVRMGLAFADEHLGTDFGPLEAARRVR